MSHRLAYFRVSSKGQSIESQRQALGGAFDKEFKDEGVSGAIPAEERPGLKELMDYARSGDTVFVYAIDRLGRDAIDVQQTVKKLTDKGVVVDVHGIGPMTGNHAKLALAMLAQIAEMERERIRGNTERGRIVARESLNKTGKTHKGKESMGRPFEHQPDEIVKWRSANAASIKQTAEHFGISTATVKRAARLLNPKQDTNN